MSQVYLDSNATGANDGTSEADAYTDVRTALSGLTFGDTLWVKNSGATYGITMGSRIDMTPLLDIGSSPEDNQYIKIKGYSGTTGDKPTGNDRPVISKLTNGVPQIVIEFPTGLICENIIFDTPYQTYATSYSDFSFNAVNRFKNCKFIARDPGASITSGGWAYSIAGNSYFYGCEFDFQVTTSNASSRSAPFMNSGGHTYFKDCVFKSIADSPPIMQGDNSYPSDSIHDCIFIGNGNNDGYYLDIADQGGQFKSAYYNKLTNNIFYNLGNAINIIPPYSVNSAADTESEWASAAERIKVTNCIFENCLTGVKVDTYTEPSGWVTGVFRMGHVTKVEDCAFYNMTTANTSGELMEDGTINLSASPFVDAPNNDFSINEIAGAGKIIREQSGNEISILDGASTFKFFAGAKLEKDFRTTDTGSLSLGTGGVGDTVNVSGKAFQLVQDNPRVWRWT